MPPYSIVTVPPGDRIHSRPDGRLDVPSHPILPFIEGDGTGPDIWRASQAVFDAAVDKAYKGKRRIAWMEDVAGEKDINRFKNWRPDDNDAGIEWPAESAEARKLIAFLQGDLGVRKIRFPATSGIGVKPVSREGTERLARAAIDYALRKKRRSVTFVHKGNIMKFTEG